jgi:hypothetical protein
MQHISFEEDSARAAQPRSPIAATKRHQSVVAVRIKSEKEEYFMTDDPNKKQNQSGSQERQSGQQQQNQGQPNQNQPNQNQYDQQNKSNKDDMSQKRPGQSGHDADRDQQEDQDRGGQRKAS